MDITINIPVTLIRSFEFRTTCYLILPHISPNATVSELFDLIEKVIHGSSAVPPPFKTFSFDALKVRHQAHKAKSENLLIDLKTEPVQRSNQTLSSLGIVNESEVAVFNLADYIAQRENPRFLW
ncbi:hypothetical protein CRM22_009742 [Opisthorchis felineus]|uniref:Uncharacterized protein n=1 Tax=Opisthorchis felineus TaxID=147828 RepID=A0A4S2LC71_OPIFE|nr:hypothetical protein CRM22_009742 [Opisthorchis felineus]